MATKSVYKSVSIKTKNECRKLVNALEQAQRKDTSKKISDTVLSRASSNMTREDMQKYFK